MATRTFGVQEAVVLDVRIQEVLKIHVSPGVRELPLGFNVTQFVVRSNDEVLARLGIAALKRRIVEICRGVTGDVDGHRVGRTPAARVNRNVLLTDFRVASGVIREWSGQKPVDRTDVVVVDDQIWPVNRSRNSAFSHDQLLEAECETR